MIVSVDVIQQAREAKLEEELLEAVGLSRGGAARAAAADMGSRTRSAATDVAGTLKAGAVRATTGVEHLWNRVTEKIEDVKERAADAREDRRIQNALGRPVTRVILDRHDAVILSVGEIVTNAAVERSRDAEVLETLLEAVSRRNPELNSETFRDTPASPRLSAHRPRAVAKSRLGKKR